MRNITPRTFVVIAIIALSFVGALAFLASSLYGSPDDRPWIRTLAARGAFPIARVDGQFVRYADYLVQQDATRIFLHSPLTQGQPMPKELDATGNKTILDQLVRAAAVRSMAQTAHIQLEKADIDRSFDALIARAGTSTDPGEIGTYLHDAFGWDIATFKERVVAPATLETAVRQEGYKNDDAAFEKALDEKMKSAVRYIRL